MKFCLIPLYDQYSKILFLYEFLDLMGQTGHGDILGRNDAPTPQHPNMSHIHVRWFSSLFMALRTKTPRAHETPPPHMLDNSFDELQG
jgi:hypothetical protein